LEGTLSYFGNDSDDDKEEEEDNDGDLYRW
jgi:hypothetical protein